VAALAIDDLTAEHEEELVQRIGMRRHPIPIAASRSAL
jgi:hypothetical protein